MKRLFIFLISLILTAWACWIGPACWVGPVTVRAAEADIQVSYLPALVETKVVEWNGRQYLMKIYESEPDVEADIQRLVEEPFEYEGYFYTYDDLQISEVMNEEKKWERQYVTLPVESEDLTAAFQQLAPSIPYEGQDGFTGQLDLDYTMVWTRVKGYEQKSFTLTDTVSYAGLSSNDSSNIPKTRQKSGVNLTLQSVDWTVQQTTTIGYDSVPSLYTAVANYSGSYSKSVPIGYEAVAWYGGNVVKYHPAGVRYSVVYAGEDLTPDTPQQVIVDAPEPESSTDVVEGTEDTAAAPAEDPGLPPEETKKNSAMPWIITGLILIALAGLGVAAYLYLNNVGVFVGDEDNYQRIARRMIKPAEPVVDLRKLGLLSGDLTVVVYKRAASKMFGKQVRTLINDSYTHRCIVNIQNDDFAYQVKITRGGPEAGIEEPSGD